MDSGFLRSERSKWKNIYVHSFSAAMETSYKSFILCGQQTAQQIIMARLRLQWYSLSARLHSITIIESPACRCGFKSEDAFHFFLFILFTICKESSKSFMCIPTLQQVDSMWLALTVLVTTIDAQWEGMGDVGLARYEPALLPPCPTIRVLSYSN